jgi:hypothetical protein
MPVTLIRATSMLLAGLLLTATSAWTDVSANAMDGQGDVSETWTSATRGTDRSIAGRRAAPITRYKCGAWHRHKRLPQLGYFRDCARFRSVKGQFRVDYRVAAHNKFRHQVIRWTCRHTETTTWRFHVSATVTAEAGVIFAKAEASITAGVDHEVTSEDSAEAPIKIRPRRWVHCIRGANTYLVKGNVRSQFKKSKHGSVSWWTGTSDRFTAHIPSSTAYIYGPGRL